MGGCATKPKVLEGDEGEVPVPVPPPEPMKEPVAVVPEAKEAADVVAEGEKKVEAVDVNEVVMAKDIDEIKEVNDDKFDDQANKRQSLSNLFKENKKGSAESDTAQPESMKKESLKSVQQESLEPVQQEPLEPVKQEPPEPVKHVSVEPVKQESVEHVKIESVEPAKIESMEPAKKELLEPKKQAPSDTEKLNEVYVKMDQEIGKYANPVEQISKP